MPIRNSKPRIALATAAAFAMLASGCGKSPDYAATVQKVNALFSDANTLDRSASQQSANPAAACAALKEASGKIEEAAKAMAELPAPDASKAKDIGWSTATDTITTQRGHFESAIKRTCPA